MQIPPYEVFIPTYSVKEELRLVKWAYDNLAPVSWSMWEEGSGLTIRFAEYEQAIVFKNAYNGFMNCEDLISFSLVNLDLRIVKEWCDENVRGNWRILAKSNDSKLVLETEEDAMLFRLSFD